MNADLINNNYSKIWKTFSEELRKVMSKVTPVYTNQPQEIDYIAALVIGFSSIWNKVSAKIIHPKPTFEISSIFCHQRPFVKMNNSSTGCELGDILFVYYYIDRMKQISLNSLLLQAKICTGRKCFLPRGDLQLKLYTEWPEFYYQKPKITNKSRNIQPKSFNIGAQYLMIDPSSINTQKESLGVALPAQNLIYDRCLAGELLSFLKFKTGRKFEIDPVPSGDDWTKMIWDLIISSANSTFNRKNINAINIERQPINILDQIFMMNNNTIQIAGEKNSEEGINIVLIKAVEND